MHSSTGFCKSSQRVITIMIKKKTYHDKKKRGGIFFWESAWRVKTVHIGWCFLGPKSACELVRYGIVERLVTERFRSPHERESKIALNSEFQDGFRIQKRYWIPDSSRWRDRSLRFLRFAVAKFPIPKLRIPNSATKKYPGVHITSYEVIM